MAVKGLFLLTICLVFLLTTARALKCYTKLNYNCTKESSTSCKNIFGKPQTKNSTDCDSGVTMCRSMTLSSGEGKKMPFELNEAGCAPKGVKPPTFKASCYKDKKNLTQLDPAMVDKLKQFESTSNITVNAVKICLCEGELCNSSVKSAVSISVIISSAVISFMLFT